MLFVRNGEGEGVGAVDGVQHNVGSLVHSHSLFLPDQCVER